MPFQISPKWLTSYTQNPMNRYVFKSLWWYKTFLTTNILVFNITMSLMMDGILILKQTLLFQAHSSPQIIEFKVDLHPSYPFWHSNSWINRVQKWFWTFFATDTLFENYSKCRIWILQFWHFPPIFVLISLTCLVTLFDRKLQVFKNSPKWTIFDLFN